MEQPPPTTTAFRPSVFSLGYDNSTLCPQLTFPHCNLNARLDFFFFFSLVLGLSRVFGVSSPSRILLHSGIELRKWQLGLWDRALGGGASSAEQFVFAGSSPGGDGVFGLLHGMDGGGLLVVYLWSTCMIDFVCFCIAYWFIGLEDNPWGTGYLL